MPIQSAHETGAPRARYGRLDALRGAAMVWMACFHFAFDLDHFGFIRQDFYRDPVWTLQRTCIVSLFLLCAGMGQAIAFAQGQPWSRFWRRWAQIAGCALLVSIGSYLMFPRSFISFGVLHGLAVMLVVTRLAAPLPSWALAVLGLAAVLLPQIVQHSFFDTRATNWVGLVTHKPVAEDYVPVLPWLGVMLWGLALGKVALGQGSRLLNGTPGPALAPLAVLGRWSLSFYMLHQPVLIGALLAVKALRG